MSTCRLSGQQLFRDFCIACIHKVTHIGPTIIYTALVSNNGASDIAKM